MPNLSDWAEIWAIDFEYQAVDGEWPVPHCMIGREILSQRLIRLDAAALHSAHVPPFSIGQNSLVVALPPGRVLLLPAAGLSSTDALSGSLHRIQMAALGYSGQERKRRV